MQEYRTIEERAEGAYTEKKSRFLGEVIPVSSMQEAQEEIARVRKQYYDARHHCYAWILGEDGSQKKAADDGEPGGTAGMPILRVLEGAGVTNVLCIVTRYFGGTLLGTGGLVRSYTTAAQDALAHAQIVRICSCTVLEIGLEYGLYDRVSYFLEQNHLTPRDVQYTDKVTITLVVQDAGVEQVQEGLRALTGGRAQVRQAEHGWFPAAVSEQEQTD